MGIAENIKRIRIEHGLTQLELGEILGVTDRAVSTWENGTAKPRVGVIQKMADYFHITKGSIVDDNGASMLLKQSEVIPIDSSRQALLESIKDFDEIDIARLQAYADFMKIGGK